MHSAPSVLASSLALLAWHNRVTRDADPSGYDAARYSHAMLCASLGVNEDALLDFVGSEGLDGVEYVPPIADALAAWLARPVA